MSCHQYMKIKDVTHICCHKYMKIKDITYMSCHKYLFVMIHLLTDPFGWNYTAELWCTVSFSSECTFVMSMW